MLEMLLIKEIIETAHYSTAINLQINNAIDGINVIALNTKF